MRLTKKRAIELSIELWEWLAETGLKKEAWSGWEKYGGLDKFSECDKVYNLCFLCEYAEMELEEEDECRRCPYSKLFGICFEQDAPFEKWDFARQKPIRKKYASLFVAQLKELQNGTDTR